MLMAQPTYKENMLESQLVNPREAVCNLHRKPRLDARKARAYRKTESGKKGNR